MRTNYTMPNARNFAVKSTTRVPRAVATSEQSGRAAVPPCLFRPIFKTPSPLLSDPHRRAAPVARQARALHAAAPLLEIAGSRRPGTIRRSFPCPLPSFADHVNGASTLGLGLTQYPNHGANRTSPTSPPQAPAPEVRRCAAMNAKWQSIGISSLVSPPRGPSLLASCLATCHDDDAVIMMTRIIT